MASAKYEQLTGQHIILLGEQQLQKAEVESQKQHIERQRTFILFVLTILAVLSVGIVIIAQLYRKRNAAYKSLARKAKEWAQDKDESVSECAADACKDPATPEDRDIMELAEQKMIAGCLYRETNLTMDALVDSRNISRHVLSRAINRVTEENFYRYVNGYRIKEAVRLISQNSRQELYIDELYERVGFSNRTTFYRVFKQFTGLSPVEFQKSCEDTEKKCILDEEDIML